MNTLVKAILPRSHIIEVSLVLKTCHWPRSGATFQHSCTSIFTPSCEVPGKGSTYSSDNSCKDKQGKREKGEDASSSMWENMISLLQHNPLFISLHSIFALTSLCHLEWNNNIRPQVPIHKIIMFLGSPQFPESVLLPQAAILHLITAMSQ